MRGILINPWTKEVTEVEVGEGIEPMYHLLTNPLGNKVDTFCLGGILENHDCLYVDDNGLLHPGNKVFNIGGMPLVGNGLILGLDEEGDSIDAKSLLVEVQSLITWTELETADV